MYKLIAIDSRHKYIDVCGYEDLSELDYFTSKFTSKDELLSEFRKKFNIQIDNIFIQYIKGEKIKNIFEIVYSNNDIPSEDEMKYKYARFLNENKDIMKESYLNKFFDSSDTYMDILRVLEDKMDNYKTRRTCYFHMLKYGKIELKEIKKQEKDYLSQLIDNIDTDDLSDESIIIDKIRSGEIEPNYYDIDDYVSMKKRR